MRVTPRNVSSFWGMEGDLRQGSTDPTGWKKGAFSGGTGRKQQALILGADLAFSKAKVACSRCQTANKPQTYTKPI